MSQSREETSEYPDRKPVGNDRNAIRKIRKISILFTLPHANEQLMTFYFPCDDEPDDPVSDSTWKQLVFYLAKSQQINNETYWFPMTESEITLFYPEIQQQKKLTRVDCGELNNQPEGYACFMPEAETSFASFSIYTDEMTLSQLVSGQKTVPQWIHEVIFKHNINARKKLQSDKQMAEKNKSQAELVLSAIHEAIKNYITIANKNQEDLEEQLRKFCVTVTNQTFSFIPAFDGNLIVFPNIDLLFFEFHMKEIIDKLFCQINDNFLTDSRKAECLYATLSQVIPIDKQKDVMTQKHIFACGHIAKIADNEEVVVTVKKKRRHNPGNTYSTFSSSSSSSSSHQAHEFQAKVKNINNNDQIKYEEDPKYQLEQAKIRVFKTLDQACAPEAPLYMLKQKPPFNDVLSTFEKFNSLTLVEIERLLANMIKNAKDQKKFLIECLVPLTMNHDEEKRILLHRDGKFKFELPALVKNLETNLAAKPERENNLLQHTLNEKKITELKNNILFNLQKVKQSLPFQTSQVAAIDAIWHAEMLALDNKLRNFDNLPVAQQILAYEEMSKVSAEMLAEINSPQVLEFIDLIIKKRALMLQMGSDASLNEDLPLLSQGINNLIINTLKRDIHELTITSEIENLKKAMKRQPNMLMLFLAHIKNIDAISENDKNILLEFFLPLQKWIMSGYDRKLFKNVRQHFQLYMTLAQATNAETLSLTETMLQQTNILQILIPLHVSMTQLEGEIRGRIQQKESDSNAEKYAKLKMYSLIENLLGGHLLSLNAAIETINTHMQTLFSGKEDLTEQVAKMQAVLKKAGKKIKNWIEVKIKLEHFQKSFNTVLKKYREDYELAAHLYHQSVKQDLLSRVNFSIPPWAILMKEEWRLRLEKMQAERAARLTKLKFLLDNFVNFYETFEFKKLMADLIIIDTKIATNVKKAEEEFITDGIMHERKLLNELYQNVKTLVQKARDNNHINFPLLPDTHNSAIQAEILADLHHQASLSFKQIDDKLAKENIHIFQDCKTWTSVAEWHSRECFHVLQEITEDKINARAKIFNSDIQPEIIPPKIKNPFWENMGGYVSGGLSTIGGGALIALGIMLLPVGGAGLALMAVGALFSALGVGGMISNAIVGEKKIVHQDFFAEWQKKEITVKYNNTELFSKMNVRIKPLPVSSNKRKIKVKKINKPEVYNYGKLLKPDLNLFSRNVEQKNKTESADKIKFKNSK